MKAWIVLVGILLVGGGAFLLFETTTRGGTHYAMGGGCGLATPPRLPDPSLGEPDADYEVPFRNGEVVRLTFPAGRYVSLVETVGARLETWSSRAHGATDEHGCTLAPFTMAHLGEGDGVARVRIWLLD